MKQGSRANSILVSTGLLTHSFPLLLFLNSLGLSLAHARVRREGDTPEKFNARLGLNATVIQIAQQIPIQPYNYVTGAGGMAPEELIERSATDAAVFLTVYPYQGLQVLTLDDYTALGNQLLNCEF
jgi:hypothetical protein